MSKNIQTQLMEPYPILFVNYHGTIGGGQIHLLTLLEGLDRSRFTPYVVCCEEGLFADSLRQKGLEPKIIPFPKAKWRNLHRSIPALWKFYRYIKQIPFKLVHVSGLQEAKLAAYPCHWAKIPMVWLVAP